MTTIQDTYKDDNWSVKIQYTAPDQPAPALKGPIHASFHDLCVDEAQRRDPKFFSYSKKKQAKILQQIRFSATERADFTCDINSTMRVHHRYLANSPLRGRCYRDEKGTIHQCQHVIASSSDRKVSQLQNARCISDDNGPICYTGRPDTQNKVKELAEMIYRAEKCEGDELPFVVTSLLNTPGMGEETRLFLQEKEALEKTKSITIDGKIVRLKPIFLSVEFNNFLHLRALLPSALSGEMLSHTILQQGLKQLTNDPALAQHLKKREISSSELIVHIDALCKKLKLPIVYHCKSSTDRTGVAVALSCAVSQTTHLPERPLDDANFKTLVTQNWVAAHLTSNIARGSNGGDVAGIAPNPNNFGLKMGKGVLQNPVLSEVLPATYFKNTPLWQRVAACAFLLLIAIPLFIPLRALCQIILFLFLIQGWEKDPITWIFAPCKLLIKFWNAKELDQEKGFMKGHSILFSKNTQKALLNDEEELEEGILDELPSALVY